MNRHAFYLTFVAITAALPVVADAQTSFVIKQLSYLGNSDVNAVAINGNGSIAATVFDPAAGSQIGVVLKGKISTVLPIPYKGSGAPIPVAINGKGDVLGYAYEGIAPHMFLLHQGKYEPQADVDLVIEQQPGPPPLPIGFGSGDTVFYTIVTGRDNPTDPIYGILPNVRSMPYLMRNQTAYSLNSSGMLGGTTFYRGASAAFVGKGKMFSELVPSDAQTSKGGYVNDSGEVAGSYIDRANTQHGFTYIGGVYKAFDVPEAAAPYSLSVTSLNNSGRVIGVYTSQSTGRQHVFFFNGKTVEAFGDFPGADIILATLNGRGTIVVSRQIQAKAPNFVSYVVSCTGPGC